MRDQDEQTEKEYRDKDVKLKLKLQSVYNHELFLYNFKQLGLAVMKAGGNPFEFVEENEQLLILLANNDIRLSATFEGDKKKASC